MITIGLKRRLEGAEDGLGNEIEAYAEQEPLNVLGIAPRNRDEPREEGRRQAVSTVWDIYAPLGTENRVGPHDRIVLPVVGETNVVGEIGVWANNPHSSNPNHGGVVFTVERKAG